MRLTFSKGYLPDNNHHWRKRLESETPVGQSQWVGRRIRGPKAMFVPLGEGPFLVVEGRRVIGLRLWIYAPSGQCWNFDVALRFNRSPYPIGHRYGPRPDWKPESAVKL